MSDLSAQGPVRGQLLGHRDFRRLWAGQTVSEIGTQVSVLAVPIAAVRVLHATTFQVGVLSAAATLPFLVVGLPAGAWIDRWRRRRVMIVTDLGRFLVLWSIPISYALGELRMLQLYLVALAAGLLTVFFQVAYQSYLPSLIGLEYITEGNAKLVGSEQVAQIAGPSLAGGLVQALGASYAIAVDAGSFLFSGSAISTIRAKEAVPAVPAGGRPRLRYEIMEGLKFVLNQPLLRAITATSTTANFFSGIMTAVEVVFLVRVVHAQPGIIGLLFAAIGVGGLAGAVLAGPFARRLGGARATLAGVGMTAAGLLIPLTTAGVGLLLFAVGYAVSAAGVVLYNINQVSLRQRLCPERLLGRMNATVRFVVTGVEPLGALAGGAIGTTIGLRPTLWLAAAGQTLAVVWLLASPLRQMRDFPQPGHPQDHRSPS